MVTGSGCPRCGGSPRTGARFCDRCGARLEEVRTPASEPGRPPGGERKHVTVLFADLRASMELLADADPEESQRRLDPILTLMIDAVHEYEGIVNQVLGDGIMALFGAPAAYEDHAVRACHAALAIQAAMARHAAGPAGRPGLDLQVRIGINSGEVVVRSIGSDLDVDYSAVGRTTHVASRLEQMAVPGTTLISPTTRHLAGGFVNARSLGSRALKGLREPMEVFELLGTGPTRAPWQAARERWRTAFVGREAELGILRAAAVDAGAGRLQLVAVAGEPGVGKSRLVAEFCRRELTGDWTVLETGTVSYGRTRAYAPVAELLRAVVGLEATTGPETARAAVERALADLACAADAPAVLAFLGIAPGPQRDWDDLDPIQRRYRTFHAVARVLRARAGRQPVCLVVEDLHWIDAESEALLNHLLAGLADAPVLLVLTYRPEYEDAWRARPYHRLLPMKPMTPAVAARLLNDLLGEDARLDGVKAMLVARTGGNPFFLEESVWNLVETGVLVGERGRYGLGRALAGDEVPGRVDGVVAARVDRLPADAKSVLQCAAMVGATFPPALVEAVAGLPGDVAVKALRDLESLDLVFPDPDAADLQYRFKHALTVDVVRGSILSDRRRALEARIVDASERLGLDRTADQIERLAHHAWRGEQWERAARYSRRAAAGAFARSAYRGAVEHLERALDALGRLPPGPALTGLAIDLRLQLRSALIPLGDLRRVVDTLRQAEALAEAAGDRRRLGLISSFLTVLFHLTGNLDRAVAHGERALAIARALDDRAIRIVAGAYLGLTCHTAGDHARALALARETVALLDGDLRAERFGMTVLPAVYARTCLVWSLAERGAFTEAAPVAAEALAIAEAVGHPYDRVYARLGAGLLGVRRADAGAAIALLEPALALCRDAGIDALFATTAALLVSAYAEAGRAGDALALVDEAVAVAASIRDPLVHWLRTGASAAALLAAGRAAEALPLAQAYREQRRRLGAKGYEAWAALLLARVETELDPAAAAATLDEALALATRLDMVPLTAHCHLGRGRLLRSAGRLAEARAAFTTARTTFAALGMVGPQAQCDAALTALARAPSG